MTSSTDLPKVPCPACGSGDSHIVKNNSRLVEIGIRRRRQCNDCGKRRTTIEIPIEWERELIASYRAAQAQKGQG